MTTQKSEFQMDSMVFQKEGNSRELSPTYRTKTFAPSKLLTISLNHISSLSVGLQNHTSASCSSHDASNNMPAEAEPYRSMVLLKHGSEMQNAPKKASGVVSSIEILT